VQPLENRDLSAGGQLAGLHDLGDRPDRREAAVHVGDEQDQAVALLCGRQGSALRVALDRQGGGHPRKDYHVVQLEDGKEFGGQFSHVQSRCAGRHGADRWLVFTNPYTPGQNF